MRVLVFKLCNNIRFGNKKETNGGNTEILVTIEHLQKLGYEVGVVTLDNYFEDAPAGVKCHSWEDHEKYNYDMAIVFNAKLNCFGGVMADPSKESYRFLANFKGQIIYAVTDTLLDISSAADWMRNAQRKGKFSDLISANDYEVDGSKIFCLTQTYDHSVLKDNWKSKENRFGQYEHFPFESTVGFRKDLKPLILDNDKCTADLIYFGNPRSGKRNKKFIEFYCGHEGLVVDVYGNWTDNHIKNLRTQLLPNFKGKLDMYELHGKINSSIAHCYISDPQNEGTIWTTRLWEAVLNRTVLFMDQANRANGRMDMEAFFYVGSRRELSAKIHQLKDNPHFRSQMLSMQYAQLGRILVSQLSNFTSLLETQLQKAKEFYATRIRESQPHVR